MQISQPLALSETYDLRDLSLADAERWLLACCIDSEEAPPDAEGKVKDSRKLS